MRAPRPEPDDEARRQGGPRDGRDEGHRAHHRNGVRARGGEGRDRRPHRGGRRAASGRDHRRRRRSDLRADRHRQRGRRRRRRAGHRRAVRRAHHARQQRRGDPSLGPARPRRRGRGRAHQRRPRRGVADESLGTRLVLQARDRGDEQGRRRLDREHLVWRGDEGRCDDGCLLGDQGRDERAHPLDGRRLREAEHPGERDLVRPDRERREHRRSCWPIPATRDWLERSIPLPYFGVPEDIAWGCVYLASDESRYVTGAVLPIDGGYLACPA